jgi:Ca2+-binding EF-hand superfamily protein
MGSCASAVPEQRNIHVVDSIALQEDNTTKQAGCKELKEDLEITFKMFDKDKDGCLNYSEVRELVHFTFYSVQEQKPEIGLKEAVA